MPTAFHVELVTPERVLFSGETEEVSLRTDGGEISFLAQPRGLHRSARHHRLQAHPGKSPARSTGPTDPRRDPRRFRPRRRFGWSSSSPGVAELGGEIDVARAPSHSAERRREPSSHRGGFRAHGDEPTAEGEGAIARSGAMLALLRARGSPRRCCVVRGAARGRQRRRSTELGAGRRPLPRRPRCLGGASRDRDRRPPPSPRLERARSNRAAPHPRPAGQRRDRCDRRRRSCVLAAAAQSSRSRSTLGPPQQRLPNQRCRSISRSPAMSPRARIASRQVAPCRPVRAAGSERARSFPTSRLDSARSRRRRADASPTSRRLRGPSFRVDAVTP